MKTKILVALALVTFASVPAVRATQAGATHYISGLQSDFSTLVPMMPGLYLGNLYLNYNDATISPGKSLPFGRIQAAGATVNLQAEVPGAIYSYPFDFFGGRLASGAFVPFTWVDVKASATIDLGGPHNITREDRAFGVGDIELLPIMMGWTNGDFSIDGMFNLWLPTGKYSTTTLANTGLGYWTFEPMVAASWLSHKIGTEVTVYSAVDFNTKNDDADYQSGDLFHVDGTVAQHLPLFGGFASVGATAFYMKQITGDSGSGAKLGGFMLKSYGVGPTISYVGHIGSHLLVMDGSWLPQTHTDNTTKGDYFWGKLIISF